MKNIYLYTAANKFSNHAGENGLRERVQTQNDEATETDDDTPKSGKQDKRPRRNSSSLSVNSQGDRKKLRIGSEFEEIMEDGSDTNEWSEDEFVVTFKNAPERAKGMMDSLKSSVSEIKSSIKKLKHEIEGLRSEVDSLKGGFLLFAETTHSELASTR